MKTTVNVGTEMTTIRGTVVKETTDEAEFECVECEYTYEASMGTTCNMCGRGAHICPLCGKAAKLIKPPVRVPMTLKSVLTAALNQPRKRDEKISVKKVVKRDKLAQRIYDADGEMSFDVEGEIHLLKQLLETAPLSTRMISQAVCLLDPDVAKDDEDDAKELEGPDAPEKLPEPKD